MHDIVTIPEQHHEDVAFPSVPTDQLSQGFGHS